MFVCFVESDKHEQEVVAFDYNKPTLSVGMVFPTLDVFKNVMISVGMVFPTLDVFKNVMMHHYMLMQNGRPSFMLGQTTLGNGTHHFFISHYNLVHHYSGVVPKNQSMGTAK